jgi:UDP-glucose 4-epimerase
MESPITEDSPFKNPSLYGLSKLAGEAIVRNHPYYAIVRYTSIVGKGMTQSTFIPRLISQATAGGTIILKGNGSRMQNYISVQDAAAFCLQGARMESNAVLLGADHKSYSNVEVAEMVKSKLLSEVIFEGEDPSNSLFYDARKTYTQLGYSPRLPLEESIADMIA